MCECDCSMFPNLLLLLQNALEKGSVGMWKVHLFPPLRFIPVRRLLFCALLYWWLWTHALQLLTQPSQLSLSPTSAALLPTSSSYYFFLLTEPKKSQIVGDSERERIGFATVNVSTQRVACSLVALPLRMRNLIIGFMPRPIWWIAR